MNFRIMMPSRMWSLVFYMGLAFLPFDNLSFAPSLGWAAISPYFFIAATFLMMVENKSVFNGVLKYAINKSGVYVVVLLLISLVAYLLSDVNWRLVGLSFLKVFLGTCFFICLVGIKRVDRIWERRALKILAFSYGLSLIVGLIQYTNILFSTSVGNSIFQSIFARYYPEKIQYTFTEPSFASMHVFGVVLPFLLCLNVHNFYSKFLKLFGVAVILLSIFSGSSLRILFDLGLVLLAFMLVLSNKQRVSYVAVISILGIALLNIFPPVLLDRIENIFSTQEISDPSAAIRKFRINAALSGTFNEPYAVVMGYGFGNSAAAINNGFSDSYDRISQSYAEIDNLREESDGLVYSMHGKLIAEHGIFLYGLILMLLWSRRHRFFWLLILISYLQFDSYAFYTVWIYFYARIFRVGEDVSVQGILRLKD